MNDLDDMREHVPFLESIHAQAVAALDAQYSRSVAVNGADETRWDGSTCHTLSTLRAAVAESSDRLDAGRAYLAELEAEQAS